MIIENPGWPRRYGIIQKIGLVSNFHSYFRKKILTSMEDFGSSHFWHLKKQQVKFSISRYIGTKRTWERPFNEIIRYRDFEKECLSKIIGYCEIWSTSYYVEVYHLPAIIAKKNSIDVPPNLFVYRQQIINGELGTKFKNPLDWLEPDLYLMCFCRKKFSPNETMFECSNYCANFYHPMCVLLDTERLCRKCKIKLPLESVIAGKKYNSW